METIPQTSSPPGAVRHVQCTLCWAPPGEPCQRLPRADHLQRWLDAYKLGRVSKTDLGDVFSQVIIITRWQVVPELAA